MATKGRSASSTAGGAYAPRAKRKRVIIDDRVYLLTPSDEANLLRTLISDAEQEERLSSIVTDHAGDRLARLKIHLALLQEAQQEEREASYEDEAIALILAIANDGYFEPPQDDEAIALILAAA